MSAVVRLRTQEHPVETDKLSAMRALYRADETACVDKLLAALNFSEQQQARITETATGLVHGMRAARTRFGGLDVFLKQYSLETTEGIALMCLAEALLRIPDTETANRLIADKLRLGDWRKHMGQSDSLFVNASTWALMLTGKVLREDEAASVAERLLNRMGEPVIRNALSHMMGVMGKQFVMGRTIAEALSRAADDRKAGYSHSFDMLGEGARTATIAEQFFESYRVAIDTIGKARLGTAPTAAAGISVKISALHPRYEAAQEETCVPAIVERLAVLATQAAGYGIPFCIDAEEAERLEISLKIIDQVARTPALQGWEGFGLAIQAYQKRAVAVCDWVADLSKQTGLRLMPRLVKGAYWDAEIKKAQERGLDGYPVYTRKVTTDVSYLVCAARLLAAGERLYPAFATHNAQTVAAIMELAGTRRSYEFQRLHGMGEPLYHQLIGGENAIRCRVYAPVGSHEELLPYLVRRLLENGANSSFINRIQNDALPVADLVADPLSQLSALASKPHPRIPLPQAMFGKERLNSRGVDFSDPAETDALLRAMRAAIANLPQPATEVSQESAGAAISQALAAYPEWSRQPVSARADALRRLADALENDRAAVLALLVDEAGKTLPDAVAELREAVDFCRYYAAEAERIMASPTTLPGPTGEQNTLAWRARGVFVAISPWNFPLAIFIGQVAAALAVGNTVVAKPAEQTPRIARHAVALAHAAGIPSEALRLLTGAGETVGAALVNDPRIAGVVFTGSTATAQAINRSLAAKTGAIVPLIAETGGINAMLVDSSALTEQVVDDVITSAFRSAGQRCSALRLLCLQDDIADRVIDMLRGAMAELRVGDPWQLSTDVGSVIDADALAMLEQHAARMDRQARLICVAPTTAQAGHFFAPRAYELASVEQLDAEIFGPILHIVRFKGEALEATIDAINAKGYGLTFGLHTRMESTVARVTSRIHAGNIYINRSMIGAVVGVQPFGGEGLSGTGPKAGGPHYLYRFATEQTLTVNTTAAGGNTSLVMLTEG